MPLEDASRAPNQGGIVVKRPPSHDGADQAIGETTAKAHWLLFHPAICD
jgi:hypothetical protein